QPTLDCEQHDNAQNVPYAFVEEGRVEEGSLGQTDRKRGVACRDLQPPRQGCRAAKEFVVKPVTETSHRLSKQQAGHERVSKRPEPHPRDPGCDEHADRAAQQRTKYSDSALPECKRIERVLAGAEVVTPV